jgi:phosphomannomutase
MNKEVFKAYDIRGIYPEEINADLVKKVVSCLKKNFWRNGKIVVGHDVRNGSEELYNTALKEIDNKDFSVVGVGLITTPMLTFLVNSLGASGGMIITASHSPKEYNGIKMVKEGGLQISGEEIYTNLAKN